MSLSDEFPWLKGAVGIFEPAATIATGMAAEIPAGLYGIWETAWAGDPKQGAQGVEDLRERYTYMPRTPEGMQNLQKVGSYMEGAMNSPKFGQWMAGVPGVLAGYEGFSVNDAVGAFQDQAGKLGPAGAAGLEGVLAAMPWDQAMFLGMAARNADRVALKKAIDLQLRGADAKDIMRQTGWFQGADGKWRFEIDDSSVPVQGMLDDLKGDDEVPLGSLGEIYPHEKLYEAYPDLADARVTQLARNRGGSYFEGGKFPERIRFSDPQVLAHEIQHAIQKREGFARGGSLSDFPNNDNTLNMINDVETRLDQLGRLQNIDEASVFKTLNEEFPHLEELVGPYGVESVADLRRSLEGAWLDALADSPLGKYRRLAGEVEARNTEDRLSMDAFERRLSPPWKTEDIPRHKQDVRFTNTGLSLSEPTGQVTKGRLSGGEDQFYHGSLVDGLNDRQNLLAENMVAQEGRLLTFEPPPEGVLAEQPLLGLPDPKTASGPLKATINKAIAPLRKPGVRARENLRHGGETVIDESARAEGRLIMPEDILGNVLVPVPGDRSRAGGQLQQVRGVPLRGALELEGGPGFSEQHAGTGAAWASMHSAASSKQRNITKAAEETGADPVGVYVAMSPEGTNFSHHVAEGMLRQVPNLDISKSAKKRFDNFVRNKAVPGQRIPDWVGIDSEYAIDQILGRGDFPMEGAGELRKRLVNAMGSAQFRNEGFPSYVDTLQAVNDPRLAGRGVGSSGLVMFEGNPGAPLIRETGHSSYSHDIPGEYLGGLAEPVPLEVMFPKTVGRLAEEGTQNIPRSIQVRHHYELADEEWLQGIMDYYRSLGLQ